MQLALSQSHPSDVDKETLRGINNFTCCIIQGKTTLGAKQQDNFKKHNN